MAVYKEERTNTWRVIYRYIDWNGARKQSQKRGYLPNGKPRRGSGNS